MSNKLTGEAEIFIGGKPYHLKPTPAAALAIEQGSPKTIRALIDDINGHRVSELAMVLHCGIAEKKKPSVNEILVEATALRQKQDFTLVIAAMTFLGGFFEPVTDEAETGNE